jgi:hypothetical protein
MIDDLENHDEVTPRRRALQAIGAIAKVPASEVAWIWVFMLTGQRPPADEMRFDRDVRIRDYRQKWHPELSERAAAKAIAREASIYRAGQWRAHEHAEGTPPEIKGTRSADLFAIFHDCGLIKSAAMVRGALRGS